MAALTYIPVAIFAAVIANDWLLASRIRKAVASNRLDAPALEGFRSAGSPLGIVLTLFRLRNLPPAYDLSDPDHIAIRQHYRIHQVLVWLLGACVVVLFLVRAAA